MKCDSFPALLGETMTVSELNDDVFGLPSYPTLAPLSPLVLDQTSSSSICPVVDSPDSSLANLTHRLQKPLRSLVDGANGSVKVASHGDPTKQLPERVTVHDDLQTGRRMRGGGNFSPEGAVCSNGHTPRNHPAPQNGSKPGLNGKLTTPANTAPPKIRNTAIGMKEEQIASNKPGGTPSWGPKASSPGNSATNWAPNALCEGSLLTYARDDGRQMGAQSLGSKYEMCRSERGGVFEGMSVLMGVRFVVG